MDLLTPARIWANTPSADHPADRVPFPQQLATSLAVIGPFIGLFFAIYLLWGHGMGWLDLGMMIGLYIMAGFGTTIGFHRLFTHRSFETSRPLRIMLAIFGTVGWQGPVIKWCAIHRRHHQLSDRVGDPHSPHLHGSGFGGLLRGMWHSHVGWHFINDANDLARSVPDLLEDRDLNFVDRYTALWVALGFILPTVIGGLVTASIWGAVSGFVWGGLVRVCTMHHATWSVNSICHVWGSRPFRIADHSTNNLPVALLSLGEGWHNNHHAFPTSARHGLRWWQFDSSWVVIRCLQMVGIVWNVRTPSESAIDAKLSTPSRGELTPPADASTSYP